MCLPSLNKVKSINQSIIYAPAGGGYNPLEGMGGGGGAKPNDQNSRMKILDRFLKGKVNKIINIVVNEYSSSEFKMGGFSCSAPVTVFTGGKAALKIAD